MKTAALTTRDYYNELASDRQEALGTVRKLIKRIWPAITEDMSLGMPTFHLEGQALCAVASQKHFMALYIMPYDLLDAFKNDLRIYDRGKSCIRFKHLEPSTVDLFDRIIKYTGSQIGLSRLVDKPGGPKGSSKARSLAIGVR
ncbi:MAG: DUF1801 domain-containing protein [Flavobacteriales bacterium]